MLGPLDHAFSGYLPGGLHPFAFLFLEIDPSLADFNIHPAKKEVRFKDPEGPRRAIHSAVQAFLGELVGATRRRPCPTLGRARAGAAAGTGATGSRGRSHRPGVFGRKAELGSLRRRARERGLGHRAALPSPLAPRDFRYLGSALGPFILFEREGALWFLDQHAAHERMLFDRLMERPPESQRLLVVQELEPEDEAEDDRIEAAAKGLRDAGFGLERDAGPGS